MIVFKKFHLQDYSDNLIVTDKKVAQIYGIAGDNVYLLPQGEQAKTIEQAEKLCVWLASKNLERNGALVAIGGGCVGDCAGFVASIYKRGLKLIHVPTTLIAQIDSSIGGKTAVNLGEIKNAVGTFYNGETFIDTAFLSTLDKDELKNGKGELLKYRMLSENIDRAYYNGDMDEIISACVDYKQQICSVDPFDNGIRQKLNFGHTIGHAMELSLNLRHGAAVANGMYYEIALAQKLQICTSDYATHWQKEITNEFTIKPLTEKVLNLIASDKKNSLGKACFILPDKFQRTFLTADEIKKLLLNA